jgi:hypothetical protein
MKTLLKSLLCAALLTGAVSLPAQAQLYFTITGNNTLNEYNSAGLLKSVSLAGDVTGADALATYNGNVYISGSGSNNVEVFNAASGTLSSLSDTFGAGGYTGLQGIAIQGSTLYVLSDRNASSIGYVDSVNLGTSALTQLGSLNTNGMTLFAVNPTGTQFYATEGGTAVGFTVAGSQIWRATAFTVTSTDMVSLGNYVYSDWTGSDVFQVSDAGQWSSTFALATTAPPAGLYADEANNDLYVVAGGTLNEYTISANYGSDTLVAGSLLTGLGSVDALAEMTPFTAPTSTPEPRSWAMALLVLGAVLGLCWKQAIGSENGSGQLDLS